MVRRDGHSPSEQKVRRVGQNSGEQNVRRVGQKLWRTNGQKSWTNSGEQTVSRAGQTLENKASAETDMTPANQGSADKSSDKQKVSILAEMENTLAKKVSRKGQYPQRRNGGQK